MRANSTAALNSLAGPVGSGPALSMRGSNSKASMQTGCEFPVAGSVRPMSHPSDLTHRGLFAEPNIVDTPMQTLMRTSSSTNNEPVSSLAGGATNNTGSSRP